MLGEQYLNAAAAAASVALKMIVCLSWCTINGVKSLNPGALPASFGQPFFYMAFVCCVNVYKSKVK